MSILSSDNLAALEQQGIELPSWAFGNSGTRFKVFGTPGTPRDPWAVSYTHLTLPTKA